MFNKPIETYRERISCTQVRSCKEHKRQFRYRYRGNSVDFSLFVAENHLQREEEPVRQQNPENKWKQIFKNPRRLGERGFFFRKEKYMVHVRANGGTIFQTQKLTKWMLLRENNNEAGGSFLSKQALFILEKWMDRRNSQIGFHIYRCVSF